MGLLTVGKWKRQIKRSRYLKGMPIENLVMVSPSPQPHPPWLNYQPMPTLSEIVAIANISAFSLFSLYSFFSPLRLRRHYHHHICGDSISLSLPRVTL